MSFRIRGQDLLTLHELSILCAASAALGLQHDQLGAVYLDDEVDDDQLLEELQLIRRAHSTGEVADAADIALSAWPEVAAEAAKVAAHWAWLESKEWNEEDHPRDPSTGRFGSGGESSTSTSADHAGGVWPNPNGPPEHVDYPMTDEQKAARAEYVTSTLDAYKQAEGDTQAQHDMREGKVGAYSPDRAAAHEKILDDAMAKYAGVPSDRQAVLFGGLAGAGKTSTLELPEAGHFGITRVGDDVTSHATINPDDMKEAMIREGLVPQIEGLSPLETAALVHEESSDLSGRLAERLIAQDKNVLFDVTMSNQASVDRKIESLASAGYDVKLGFVSVTVDKSEERSLSRWERGVNSFQENPSSLGGRFVPSSVIQAQSDSEWRSKNEAVFERVRNDPAVSASIKFDNMGDHPTFVDAT